MQAGSGCRCAGSERRQAADAGWPQVPAAWQWLRAGQVQVWVDSCRRQAVGSAGSGSHAGRHRQASSRQEELCQAGCPSNALPAHCR